MWVHYFTPATKKQSNQWTEGGESAPKRAKIIPYAGNIMGSLFSDARGIIFIDYLQKGKTINGEYYANLLERLSDAIKKKTAAFGEKESIVSSKQCISSHIRYQNCQN